MLIAPVLYHTTTLKESRQEEKIVVVKDNLSTCKQIVSLQWRAIHANDQKIAAHENIFIDLYQRLGLNDRLQPLIATKAWKNTNGELWPSVARKMLGIKDVDILGEVPTGKVDWENVADKR